MKQTNTEIVHFDASIFTVETVKKATYRFLDRFAPTIGLDGAAIACHLNFPEGTSRQVIADTVDELKKEVLDQDLRKIVANETTAYRNAILALAFSSSKLTKDE